MRHRGDDRPDPSDVAEDEADEQAAGGSAHREAAARGRDVDQSEGDAEHHAQCQPGRVDVRHPALGVAEVGADLRHPGGGSDDAKAVAHLDDEVRVGDEVDVATADAARGRAELLEIELVDGVPGELRVGQRHPAVVEVVAVVDDVVRGAVAEPRGDVLDQVARADGSHQVARPEHLVLAGHLGVAGGMLVLDPGERDLAAVPVAELAHGDRLAAVDPDRLVDQRLGQGLVGMATQHPRGGQHHPEHAPEVGDRVPDRRSARVGSTLARRGECRRVGQ